jgi:hypothetical protein
VTVVPLLRRSSRAIQSASALRRFSSLMVMPLMRKGLLTNTPSRGNQADTRCPPYNSVAPGPIN